jgi:hypothetical protein
MQADHRLSISGKDWPGLSKIRTPSEWRSAVLPLFAGRTSLPYQFYGEEFVNRDDEALKKSMGYRARKTGLLRPVVGMYLCRLPVKFSAAMTLKKKISLFSKSARHMLLAV